MGQATRRTVTTSLRSRWICCNTACVVRVRTRSAWRGTHRAISVQSILDLPEDNHSAGFGGERGWPVLLLVRRPGLRVVLVGQLTRPEADRKRVGFELVDPEVGRRRQVHVDV